jgi:hypothetical protein
MQEGCPKCEDPKIYVYVYIKDTKRGRGERRKQDAA